MSVLDADSALAATLTTAIHAGDVTAIRALLAEHPGLSRAWVRGSDGCERSLLHLLTDWPGHFPHAPAVVSILAEAGADVNARFRGEHAETPLHWAASSDDVGALDALVEAGADVEAPGAVLGGGTPIADAVGFGQWRAARRLLEHGAQANLWQAAALGLLDCVGELCSEGAPGADEITHAFWQACHGGQRRTAEYLLGRGADINWVGWNEQTPLDIALSQDHSETPALADWLRSRGAKTAAELTTDP
jgi:ankyrin repeat protein